jgi:hypothetical protein
MTSKTSEPVTASPAAVGPAGEPANAANSCAGDAAGGTGGRNASGGKTWAWAATMDKATATPVERSKLE